MHTRLKFSSLMLPLVFLLAACGQTGPLYLPGNPSQIETEVPVEDQAADEEEEKDDDTGA